MVTAQKDPKTKKQQDDNQANPVVISRGAAGKEAENPISFEDEAAIVAEIQDRSAAIDREALEKVREKIPDAKQAMPEVELAPEVEDAGVKSPQKEADNVVIRGSEVDLPISEAEYNQGKEIKVGGKSVDKSIVGVSSFIALTMWIGRLIKMAHKHAMRVVFRKE